MATLELLEREKTHVTAKLMADYEDLRATTTSTAGKGVGKGELRVRLHASIQVFRSVSTSSSAFCVVHTQSPLFPAARGSAGGSACSL